MGLVSAFLSGPQEIIPAGQTKVELFVFTHDNLNKGTAKWQIKEGANTYNVTADAGGHGKILVPSGKTYTVTLTISGTYEGGKTTSFVANSCEVVLCHFILGDQVTKSGAQVITGAKHFSAQPTADTRAYNPANKTDLVSIKSLQESSDVVHTSGNEDIAGVKNFLNDVYIGSGGNSDRFLRVYNDTIGVSYDEISNGMVGRIGGVIARSRTQNIIENSYWVGATNTRVEFRLYRPNASDVNVNHIVTILVDSDGERWVTLGMRSSPGSSDAVNVKYVLDRVAEMTQFTTNEVNKHATKKNNPHAVTKTQVGLGNVDNTSDVNKPISTATQNALNGKQDKFNLYEHSIRIRTAGPLIGLSLSLTVLNQSPTAFTLPTLRSYLGSEADDFMQCSGVRRDPNNLILITAVRGGTSTVLIIEGVNSSTGELVNLSLNWANTEVLLADKVRQIV